MTKDKMNKESLNNNEITENTYGTVREELRHWPYTIYQIDDTLDISLIEGRAKQILFQALNTRNLTAFVGSGVSAAYGRMSWSSWQKAQLSTTVLLTNTFIDLTNSSIARAEFLTECLDKMRDQFPPVIESDLRTTNRWLIHRLQKVRYIQQELMKLKSSFDLAQGDNNDFPGGDGLPIKFEIAQKLHDLVLANRELYLTNKLDKEKDKEEYRAEINSTIFWGIRPDTAAGAPTNSIENARRKICDIMKSHKSTSKSSENILSKDDNKIQEMRLKLLAYKDIAERPEGSMTFEDLAKALLVDECAHAGQILVSGLDSNKIDGRTTAFPAEKLVDLKNKINTLSTDNFKRDTDGIRQNPKRFAVLQRFRIDKFVELLNNPIHHSKEYKNSNKVWPDLFLSLSKRFEEYTERTDNERIFLTPTSRFLVKMVLQLSPNPEKTLELITNNEKLKASDFISRRSIIANRLDPLDRTVRQLNINRYLTTNYDFEIERFYQDIGYRHLEFTGKANGKSRSRTGKRKFDREDYRVDGLGSILWDSCFDPSSASDLITFATANDGAEATVFHLHGRATELDPLVITERNYMDMYVRNDKHREMIDEGIAMAFSATPILFIGLGMEEADVLRPLRQFISDNDRSRGYTAMVLLPADKSIQARSKFASSLYLRYGTHTIFFGSGVIPMGSNGSPDRRRVAIDWLFRIQTLIRTMSVITDKEIEVAGKETNHLDTIDKQTLKELKLPLVDPDLNLEKINEAVGTFGKELEQPGIEITDDILPILFGLTELKKASDLCKTTPGKPLPTLKSPIFTTHRPGTQSQARENWMKTDSADVDGNEFLGFYLELLTHMVRLVLHSPQPSLNANTYLRELAARQTVLQGLGGALLTAALNASLTGIEKEWRSWWKHWQHRPPHRKALIDEVQTPPEKVWRNTLPRRFIRYSVINSISDLSKSQNTECTAFDLSGGRPNELTHIRSFDTFIEAVATQTVNILAKNSDDGGRRFYTVAAETGLGKGTFFSVLSTRLGFSSYLQAAHPHWDASHRREDCPDRVVVMGGLFLNFSFSTEIASVYDMSLEVIKEILCWLYALQWTISETQNGMSTEQIDKIIHIPVTEINTQPKLMPQQLDRLKKLFATEKTWSKTLSDLLTRGKNYDPEPNLDADVTLLFDLVCERSKIALDHLEIEFRGIGRSEYLRAVTNKFGHLSKIFTGSTNKRYETRTLKPRIVICLNSCELFFDSNRQTKNLEIADFLGFLGSEAMSSNPIDIIAIGSESKLGAPWNTDIPLLKKKNSESSPLTNVAILRRNCNARAKHNIYRRAELSSIYFEGTNGTSSQTNSCPANFCNYIYYARVLDPTRLLVDNFLPLAAIFYLHGSADAFDHYNSATEFRRVYRKFQTDHLHAWSRSEIAEIEKVSKDHKMGFLNSVHQISMGIDSSLPKDIHAFQEHLVNSYRTKSSRELEDWRQIRQALSANRYGMTILLAAAQEISLSEDNWFKGAEKAHAFIRNTVDRIRNVSVSISAGIVLQAALDVYRLHHRIGSPYYDVELHHHLLRGIAVINSPISTNVIVRLPAVREYLNSIGDVDDGGLGRRRLVAKALTVLGDRGLAFRLSPHANLIKLAAIRDDFHEQKNNEYKFYEKADSEWPEKLEYRYSLHKLVQQYCITKLGSTAIEPVRINSFAPSLYASMPSGVPRLSHEAYRYLRALMIGLSQYPDIPHANQDDPVWLYSAQDRTTSIQCLRAAMSMVRSTFSIAVVSRLEEYKSIPGESEQRSRGYFETYKVRLRWIIRKAWELHVPETKDANPPHKYGFNANQNADNFRRINALYRDEIVWLYNEVGLTCLVQGNLRDAIAHLRQAIALNNEIEGNGGGRQHCLISLNLAITQMERGRLKNAEARLESIGKRQKKHRGRIYFLSRGYLGLVMHLTGRRKRAHKLLQQAISFFEQSGEDRAIAIFKNHLARLLPERQNDIALDCLKSARESAESGGHEDIRHHILISTARVSQLTQENPHKRLKRDRLIVQEVEEYSRIMGIPALTCDALHTRALILLANGDSTSSGRLLIRAMAIAKRNDLQLRLTSMMTAYARILLHRGSIVSAHRLLISSLETAKRYDYALQIDRTQRILEDEEFHIEH